MALASEGRSVQLLSRLLDGLAVAPAIPVTGLASDSRFVDKGDLFFAVKGESMDGRDFLSQAAAQGAVAIVAEQGVTETQRKSVAAIPVLEIKGLDRVVGEVASRFYGRPSEAMATAGVTGTNGKTTTSRILAHLLRAGGERCGVIGTLGASLDDAVVEAQNTTPGPISLQRQLAEWRDQGTTAVVMEVSSHSLVQHRVAGVRFDTAMFTNLSRDHLDYHGDMATYARAKARLFASEGLEHAVINRDDPWADVMISALASSTTLHLYSLKGGEVAVSASAAHYHGSGLEARVHTPWGDGRLQSSLVGNFNLSNLLAAITAACLAGMDLQDVLNAVSTLVGVDGRMQRVSNDRDLQLVVDYAHTPDALANVLQALRAHTPGQLWCVFGCGGDRDAGKRSEMGRIASELSDRMVITSDNPRSEAPMKIIDDILEGVPTARMRQAAAEPDRAKAIALAVADARPGDCVLVAGKGHEDYQLLGADRLAFSDVAALRQALESAP